MTERNLIVTLDTTAGVPMPAANTFGGFRITLTAPSGAAGAPVVTTETVVRFDGVVAGATYQLRAESITTDGQRIGVPVDIAVLVPVENSGTYTRINGVSLQFT